MPHSAKLRTLYVGGLPASASSEPLRAACERFGVVEDLRFLPRQGGAIVYVTFVDQKAAHLACMTLDGTSLDGHRLRVAFAS